MESVAFGDRQLVELGVCVRDVAWLELGLFFAADLVPELRPVLLLLSDLLPVDVSFSVLEFVAEGHHLETTHVSQRRLVGD